MKKILLVIAIMLSVSVNAQVIQRVNLNSIGLSVNVCYDSTDYREGYSCDFSVDVENIKLQPQYRNFVNLCKELSSQDTIPYFVCQNTTKQSMTEYRRIIVRNGLQQWIFNVELLTEAQQLIYNEFIDKVKTQL